MRRDPRGARRILVVDDAEGIRTYLANLLEVHGYQVDTAEDGRRALALLEAGAAPDAVLLDVMMPGLDGPSTLSALRSSPRTASIPVVFLTAKAMPAEIERLRGLGAKGVLIKPFDPMALPGQLTALLEGR